LLSGFLEIIRPFEPRWSKQWSKFEVLTRIHYIISGNTQNNMNRNEQYFKKYEEKREKDDATKLLKNIWVKESKKLLSIQWGTSFVRNSNWWQTNQSYSNGKTVPWWEPPRDHRICTALDETRTAISARESSTKDGHQNSHSTDPHKELESSNSQTNPPTIADQFTLFEMHNESNRNSTEGANITIGAIQQSSTRVSNHTNLSLRKEDGRSKPK
jgi:hypothetical protein